MDTSTTLEEQIQALMDSLADTALSAAESRHQSQAGEAHLLYALYRNDGLVGSMLRGYGLESSEIRLLMSDIPNRPLKMGEDPVLSSSSRHILHDAHDAVEVLRHCFAVRVPLPLGAGRNHSFLFSILRVMW